MKVPAAHAVQALLPTLDAKVPTSHSEHTVAPTLADGRTLNLPVGHAAHCEWPVWLAKKPGWQGWHTA
jgi:hypothetical protein